MNQLNWLEPYSRPPKNPGQNIAKIKDFIDESIHSFELLKTRDKDPSIAARRTLIRKTTDYIAERSGYGKPFIYYFSKKLTSTNSIGPLELDHAIPVKTIDSNLLVNLHSNLKFMLFPVLCFLTKAEHNSITSSNIEIDPMLPFKHYTNISVIKSIDGVEIEKEKFSFNDHIEYLEENNEIYFRLKELI